MDYICAHMLESDGECVNITVSLISDQFCTAVFITPGVMTLNTADLTSDPV